MKRKTREEKAITLIALIITIVVLLILAVVAINAVTGDGIIQHAVNAKTDYEKAQAEENSMISYYQTYLNVEGQTGEWIQNKTKLTRLNEDGSVDELEVGDSITNYQSNKNNAIEWKVLGVEDGKVLLVSSTDVAIKTLEGKEGYLNAITELNNLCAGYDDGIGAIDGSARSITVEDVNRVTGYNPLKPGNGELYYNDAIGKVTQYSNKVTYTLTEEGKIYFSSLMQSGESPYDPKFKIVEGTVLVKESEYNSEDNKTAKSITIESTRYVYYPIPLSSDKTDTMVRGISKESKAYELLFKDTAIWLASLATETADGYVRYLVRRVRSENVAAHSLYLSVETTGSFENGVRAVIGLNSNVQFTKVGEHSYTVSVPNK